MATDTVRQMSLGRELFLPDMAMRAVRDSRYRNTAYAICELIDNSIDAKASRVELLLQEHQERVKSQNRWKVFKLAVADNGHGMSSEELVQALRFGGGQRSSSFQAIGKYGMGLPTASVSQCRRVDVWTWTRQSSIDQPSHSYLDVGAIEAGKLVNVPEPDSEPIPDEWRKMLSKDALDPSQGTIVVWRDLDRIKGEARTLFSQVEREIGRIYRHFIVEDKVAIRTAAFREGQILPHRDSEVRPNDPLYLMRDTATSEPWHEEPMFDRYPSPEEYRIVVNGREEVIDVTYSIVKLKALGAQRANPGSLPHGRDARRNIGVSVVRENREIVLDRSFMREGGGFEDPRNRWWGCEVRFGSGCDDIFGVDHNKQMAAAFTQAALEVVATDSDTQEALDELGEEYEDLYKIVADIRDTTRSMMKDIDVMFDQRSSLGKPEPGEPPPVHEEAVELAKNAARGAIERGFEVPTGADRERNELGEQQRIDDLEEYLRESGYVEDIAKQLAKEWIQNDRWYSFTSGQLDGNQMFSVRRRGAVLDVRLNIHHPVYQFLEVIKKEAEQSGNEVARRAALGIIAMLLSWGRMEDGIELTARRREVQDIATNWGRQVSEVLRLLNERNLRA